MKLSELKEDAKHVTKAGFIPYFHKDGDVYFLFMVPSNPMYGGSMPGIAKGAIDSGEDKLTAALREAEEELGLKRSNIKADTLELGWVGEITGNIEHYKMAIYYGEVRSDKDFSKPHFETGATMWLTSEEFMVQGRKSQRHIVKEITQKLLNK